MLLGDLDERLVSMVPPPRRVAGQLLQEQGRLLDAVAANAVMREADTDQDGKASTSEVARFLEEHPGPWNGWCLAPKRLIEAAASNTWTSDMTSLFG